MFGLPRRVLQPSPPLPLPCPWPGLPFTLLRWLLPLSLRPARSCSSGVLWCCRRDVRNLSVALVRHTRYGVRKSADSDSDHNEMPNTYHRYTHAAATTTSAAAGIKCQLVHTSHSPCAASRPWRALRAGGQHTLAPPDPSARCSCCRCPATALRLQHSGWLGVALIGCCRRVGASAMSVGYRGRQLALLHTAASAVRQETCKDSRQDTAQRGACSQIPVGTTGWASGAGPTCRQVQVLEAHRAEQRLWQGLYIVGLRRCKQMWFSILTPRRPQHVQEW